MFNLHRRCDECTACCFALEVKKLDKSINVWCQFCQPASGCRIYHQRPRECRQYKCQWLTGLGEESDRPDRSGFILDYANNWLSGINLLRFWEWQEGSLGQEASLLLTKKCLDLGIAVLGAFKDQRLLIFETPQEVFSDKIRRDLEKEGVRIQTGEILVSSRCLSCQKQFSVDNPDFGGGVCRGCWATSH